MSRTVRYILTILIIGAVALWFLTVYRSCERKKQLEDTTIISSTGADDNNGYSDSEEVDDLYVDEDEDDTSNEASNDTSNEASEVDDTDSADNSGEEGTGADNESGGVFEDGEADIAGEYLVVAGAFISKENAEAHIRKLKQSGVDAERRVFLGSDYHSVVIGNFDSEGAARSVAKKLGTEAYVHKKRYLKKR